MGLFNFSLSGEKKHSKQESTDTKKETAKTSLDELVSQLGTTSTAGTQAQTQTGRTVGSQTGEQITAQTGQKAVEVSSLDLQTQQLLRDIISSTGQSVLGTSLPNVIAARALSGDLQASVAPILSEARTKGERQLGRTQTQLAGEAGSSLNSLVQQLGLEGRAQLEEQVANIASQLNLAARQTQTQELTAASELQQQQLASLLGILKGATTTETGTTAEQATTQQQQQTVSDILQQLTGSTSQQTTSQQQTTTAREIEQLLSTIATGFQRGRESKFGFNAGLGS